MSAIDQKMATLAQRFAARAADERAGLAAELAQDDRDAVRQRAHKLAGIAPMFGFPALGEAALDLEMAAEEDADMAAPGAAVLALLEAIFRPQ